MSRSFTVRPSAKSSIQPKKSQNSAQSKKPQQMESEGNLDGVGVEEKTNNDFDQRSIRRDAYTVIKPNASKREKMETTAKKEEEAYNRYKQAKKPASVSYVGTVGGGQAPTQSSPPRRQLNTSTQSPFQKSRNFQAAKRKEEDQKLQQHKAMQRLKAERNTERDSARHRRLGEQHRAANDAFLARIEQQTKEKQQQQRRDHVLSSSAAQHVSSSGAEQWRSAEWDDAERQRDDAERQWDDAERQWDDAERQWDDAESYENSTVREALRGPLSGSYTGQSRVSRHDASPLQQLQRRFPHCDSQYLDDLLMQTGGDVSAVCALLE